MLSAHFNLILLPLSFNRFCIHIRHCNSTWLLTISQPHPAYFSHCFPHGEASIWNFLFLSRHLCWALSSWLDTVWTIKRLIEYSKSLWKCYRLPLCSIKMSASLLLFPNGSEGKNPPVMQETWVQSLGWEDPSEKEMAIHSSILAWEIP